MCGEPQVTAPSPSRTLCSSLPSAMPAGWLWADWKGSGGLISLTNESASRCFQELTALKKAWVQPAPFSRCLQSSLSCWGLCLGTKCSGLTQPLSHTDVL